MSARNNNNNTEKTALLPTARTAFVSGDTEASRKYHENKTKSEEAHQSEGGFLKPIIFGGLDGILTSFAICAGAAGGHLSVENGFSFWVSRNIFCGCSEYGRGRVLVEQSQQ